MTPTSLTIWHNGKCYVFQVTTFPISYTNDDDILIIKSNDEILAVFHHGWSMQVGYVEVPVKQ